MRNTASPNAFLVSLPYFLISFMSVYGPKRQTSHQLTLHGYQRPRNFPQCLLTDAINFFFIIIIKEQLEKSNVAFILRP